MAGAPIVIALMPAAFSAIAFESLFCPTSCGMIAWRAGIMNEKSAPCTIEEIKRCCHAITPAFIITPSTSARSAAASCAP